MKTKEEIKDTLDEWEAESRDFRARTCQQPHGVSLSIEDIEALADLLQWVRDSRGHEEPYVEFYTDEYNEITFGVHLHNCSGPDGMEHIEVGPFWLNDGPWKRKFMWGHVSHWVYAA